MYKSLSDIPKIELHCHLDGSVRPETLRELAQTSGMVSEADLNRLEELMRAPVSCQSLVEYIACFKLPISLMQTEAHLERIARELIEDVSSQGVRYIEVRFAPQFHMSEGLSFEQVVSAVLKGLRMGEETTGTIAQLILCCMRHLPVENSIDLVKRAHPFLGHGVVAVDLAGDEHNFAPELHEEAFLLAKRLGFKITIHAGETGIGKNVTTSIQKLGADRIGHGLFIKDDPEAYALVKETGVLLEMCPTSNIQTRAVGSYQEHPFLSFLEDGLSVSLNTDNMTVSDVTLVKELDHLRPFMNDFYAQYFKSYRNALKACFATETQKQLLESYIPKGY